MGEGIAERHLTGLGYDLVERNWRCHSGEIDLVLLDVDELVFVEVKTRRGERTQRAGDAISPAKARRLLALGSHYLEAHPEHEDRIWRCDLVAITIQVSGPARVEHFINAIYE